MFSQCPVRLILLHFVALIIPGEEYTLSKWSLYNFLHNIIIYSPLGAVTKYVLTKTKKAT
jgi:hypothetical protein